MSHQQLQAIVEMLRSQPVVNPNASVEEARAGFEQVASMFPVDADIKREVVIAGGVKAEWVSAPDTDAGRAVLYLHGGGYVIGSINTHRSLAARLSRASKARVLVIDYRLAPEHPHPAAVDDSVAAYRWMLGQGQEYEAAKARYVPFDRIVDPDPAAREAIVGVVRRGLDARRPAYVIVNNKAEGSAPSSVALLARALVDALG